MDSNDGKSSPWNRESWLGIIAALCSLGGIIAISIFGFTFAKTTSFVAIIAVVSVVLSAIAALTKITAVHVTFHQARKKRKKKKEKGR